MSYHVTSHSRLSALIRAAEKSWAVWERGYSKGCVYEYIELMYLVTFASRLYRKCFQISGLSMSTLLEMGSYSSTTMCQYWYNHLIY